MAFFCLATAIIITFVIINKYGQKIKYFKTHNSYHEYTSENFDCKNETEEYTIDDLFDKKDTLPKYTKKKLVSKTEIAFGKAIKKALPEGYRLQPQICLASILRKKGDSKFANELFRIIDFGIFDKEFNILFLIEINDESHNKRKRIARDYKVKDICEEAGIPLITFWTSYGIDEQYIKKRILQEIDNAA